MADFQTVGSLVNRLVRYIKDDGAIVAHAKREFGATITARDVQKARRRQAVYRKPELEPLASPDASNWERQAAADNRRFLKKIASAAKA